MMIVTVYDHHHCSCWSRWWSSPSMIITWSSTSIERSSIECVAMSMIMWCEKILCWPKIIFVNFWSVVKIWMYPSIICPPPTVGWLSQLLYRLRFWALNFKIFGSVNSDFQTCISCYYISSSEWPNSGDLVLVYVQNMDLNLWSDFTCLYNGDLFMKCEIWSGPNFIKENTKENRRSKINNIERLKIQSLYTINFGPPIFLCIFLYEIWAWSDFTFHE